MLGGVDDGVKGRRLIYCHNVDEDGERDAGNWWRVVEGEKNAGQIYDHKQKPRRWRWAPRVEE
jgi:hypothetical protein